MGRRRIVSHEPVWTCDCKQDHLLPRLGAGTVRGSSLPADHESRVEIGLQLLRQWMVMEMYALTYKLIKLRTGMKLWKFIAHGRVRVVREERDQTLPWLHEEEEGGCFFHGCSARFSSDVMHPLKNVTIAVMRLQIEENIQKL